jgi:hypothetical protein
VQRFLGPQHVVVSEVLATAHSVQGTRTLVTEYFERLGNVEESTDSSLTATKGSLGKTMGAGAKAFPARWEVRWEAVGNGSEVTASGTDDLRMFGRRISLRPGSQRSYERSLACDLEGLRTHLAAHA